MLNIELANNAMLEKGLSQRELAKLCGVSPEAVSNWLKGESLPRPNKLKALADTLALDVHRLLGGNSLAEPVVAYRTKRNVPASVKTMKAAGDLARHLREIVPFVRSESLFTPPALDKPRLDGEYIRNVARQVRAQVGLSLVAPIPRDQLLELHYAFGSILVPVLWPGDKTGHENALSVYLPESKLSFVVLSLNARNDDFNYWLAHELGHCYTLPILQGDDGENFAERFAQELLFPYEAAIEALNDIRVSDAPMERAQYFANAYDISIVTIIRQADRIAEELGQEITGLITDKFWDDWNRNRSSVPSVALALFGSEHLSTEEYVDNCQSAFKTPIFKAIAYRQQAEGARSPSYIATALNIGLESALDLSLYLAKHYPIPSQGADSSNNCL